MTYVTEILRGYVDENVGLIVVSTSVQLLLVLLQYVVIPMLVANIVDDCETFVTSVIYLIGGYILYSVLAGVVAYMDTILEPALHEYITLKIARLVLQSASVTPTNVSTAIENMTIIRNTVHDLSYMLMTGIFPRMIVLLVSCVTLFSIHTELALSTLGLTLLSFTVQFVTFQEGDSFTDGSSSDRDIFTRTWKIC